MIKKVAERITKFVCRGSNISSDMQDVYQYGIELTISTILNLLLIILVSAALCDIFSGLIFLAVFIIIRSFTGGYHARSYFKCNIVFVLTFLLVWCAVQGMSAIPDGGLANRLLEAIVLLSFIPVIAYAPIENKNKTLDKNKRKRCRIIGIALYICTALSALVIQYVNIKYGSMMALTLSAVSIMMIIEILKIRR